MHSSSVSYAALVAVVLSALNAHVAAFHVESGTACKTVGAACSYISDDSSAKGSATTTVNGFCAPDYTCASNGATCTSDDQCFNYCGSGTCGGTGAGCNSQDAFALNQVTITCNTGYTCSANSSVGKCQKDDTTSTSSTTNTTQQNKSAPKIGIVANAPSDTDSAPVSNGSGAVAARRAKRRFPELEHRQVRARDLRMAAKLQ